MKQNWYHKDQGNGQGLIIDEATGRNVAVSYDSKDAALLASAPELLEALMELADLMEDILSGDYKPDSFTCQPARRAIAKATQS